ncbi:MAG: hypothetical protein B0D91_00510 [Oceanospirillales bacterium LUC14_002_19_P2]|nr:MAG: hypothetical protein B0D91_00510 [Oceanospirillales bacterium LUC14_002_19_P2]
MTDVFSAMTESVLASLGQSLTVLRKDGNSESVTGILSRNVTPVGSLEAVMQSMTTVALDRQIRLERSDQVISGSESWRVDRRLNDDGYLTTWNLHAADH